MHVERGEETHMGHACYSFGGYSLHFSVSLVPNNPGVKLSFPSRSAAHLSESVRAARLVYPTDRYRGSATRLALATIPGHSPHTRLMPPPYPSMHSAERHWPC